MTKELSPAGEIEMYASATAALLDTAKKSPDARAAGAELAKALKTVGEFANTLLLPLAAANYGARKFRDYMTSKFANELAGHLAGTPSESVIPPRAVVAGPVLDALVYAHEEGELRHLYLALLARAMDARQSTDAHPAFVDVLKQIDSAEVELLRAVLCSDGIVPIVAIRARGERGVVDVYSDVLDWRSDGKPRSGKELLAYVRNWTRLGLVKVDYTEHLTLPGSYAWIAQRPEYVGAVNAYREMNAASSDDPKVVVAMRGVLEITSWGEAFASAVNIRAEDGGPMAELGAWIMADFDEANDKVVYG